MYFKLLEMQCTFPLIFDSVNNDFYPIRRIVFFQPPFFMCLSVEVLLNIRTMGSNHGGFHKAKFICTFKNIYTMLLEKQRHIY